MFGMFKAKPVDKFSVMKHHVEVASIMRDGRPLFTSDTVRAYSKSHMEGQIFEIMFSTRSGAPYFVYYLCPDYYRAVVGSNGAGTFGGSHKTEEFRNAVSQQICNFLTQYLLKVHKIDARADIVSFSHNRAHTNVLTYVPLLADWYAIQHNDTEDENASEEKVEDIQNGSALITDFVAVTCLSPVR